MKTNLYFEMQIALGFFALFGTLATSAETIPDQRLLVTKILYRAVEVRTPSGFESIRVTALNNNGQLVGSLNSSNNVTHAFVWENGTITDLGTLGGSKSLANDINDSGEIVGTILQGDERHAFLWKKSGLRDLGIIDRFGKLGYEGENYLSGPGQIFYIPQIAINNSGQVTGHLTFGNDEHQSFILNQGQVAYFGLIGNSSIFYAESINDRGEILGRATQHEGKMRAMLWQNGKVIDLGSLNGMASNASSINNFGVVIGNMTRTDNGLSETLAFRWENGKVNYLNAGSSHQNHASDINDSGMIVGSAQSSENILFACLWMGDDLLDLNLLLENKSDWHFANAIRINDRGQILVSGRKDKESRYFLLSPSRELETHSAKVLSPVPSGIRPVPATNSEAAVARINLISVQRRPNGAFAMAFSGIPARKYIVEASTDLAAWTTIGAATNSGGRVEFSDTNTEHFSMRFYRAKLAP